MSRNDPEPLSVPGVEGRAVRARPARATLAAVTTLPYVDEPRDLRLAFNTPESLVKYPAIRTTPREADPARRRSRQAGVGGLESAAEARRGDVAGLPLRLLKQPGCVPGVGGR